MKLLIAPPGEPIRLVSHQRALKIVQGFKPKLFCWKIIYYIIFFMIFFCRFYMKTKTAQIEKVHQCISPLLFLHIRCHYKTQMICPTVLCFHFVAHMWFHCLDALCSINAIYMFSVFIVCLFLICTVQHSFSPSKVARVSPLWFFFPTVVY